MRGAGTRLSVAESLSLRVKVIWSQVLDVKYYCIIHYIIHIPGPSDIVAFVAFGVRVISSVAL